MAKQNALNLAINVNGKEVGNTLKELDKQFYRLRNSVKKLETGTDEWVEANKQLAVVERERKRQIDLQRQFREEIKKTIDAQEESANVLGQFGENLSYSLLALKNGDMVAFQSAWKGVASNIGVATRAAMAFVATPVGAVIAALAGIAAITREWVDYNAEALKANQLTQQITGLTGQSLDDARIRAGAIEETFGTDFKQSLETAKKLVEGFGVSYEEAFDTIENGLIRGGQENDEFLKSLNEYPKLFSQAGFSVEEFQSIVNTGIDLGVYDDKLPDAIKEFSLSVLEQTTSSREALENAFGEEFTSNLFKNINNGSITVKEALSLVAQQTEDIGLNAQQAQQLTADLFRGAGEDAGGALVIFDAVNQALNEEQRTLTELEGYTKLLAEANRDLADAKDAALKSDGYVELSNGIAIFWRKVKTDFFNAISFISGKFSELTNFTAKKIGQITVLLSSAPTIIKETFISLKDEIFDVVKSVGGLGDVVTKLLKFDFDGAKQAAKDFKDNFKKEIGDVKNTASSAYNQIKNIYDSTGELIDKQQAQFRAANEANNTAPENNVDPIKLTPSSNLSPSEEDARRKEAEEAAKKRQEEEAKRLEEERERQLKGLIEFEKLKQDTLDNLSLERAESEKEKELLQEQIRRDRELEKFKDQFNAIQLNEDEKNQVLQALTEIHEKKLNEIKEKYRKADIEGQKQALLAKKQLLSDSLNAAISAAGAETKVGRALVLAKQILAAKEMAIALGLFKAKSTLTVAEAVGDAAAGEVKTAASVPFPANIPLIIGFIAQISGIINTIKNISKTKVKTTGFYKGGYTDGFGMGYSDESGHEVAGIVHTGEYVVPKIVRNDPEVPAILDYLESKRQQKLGKSSSTTDSSSSPASTVSSESNSMLTTAIYSLLDRLNEPFVGNILWGYDAEEKRQKVQKDLDRVKESSKIN